jgi:hypothetical protein
VENFTSSPIRRGKRKTKFTENIKVLYIKVMKKAKSINNSIRILGIEWVEKRIRMKPRVKEREKRNKSGPKLR